jgi:hypothetical protein
MLAAWAEAPAGTWIRSVVAYAVVHGLRKSLNKNGGIPRDVTQGTRDGNTVKLPFRLCNGGVI